MRKLIALTTVLALGLSNLPVMAESPPGSTPAGSYVLRAQTEEIIVFATRSLKGNIAGFLRPGEDQHVQVLQVDDDWCYISFDAAYGTGYGYVPLSYFDADIQITPTPVPTVSYQAGTTAWVCNVGNGYRLNLRAEPHASAASLGKYFTGTPVVLTGVMADGFAQVMLAETALGWMDLRYLTTDALSFAPETPLLSVKNSGATLRAGPDADSARLGWFSRGSAVTVLGIRSDGWYHVAVDGQYGYMSESVLSGTFSFEHGLDSDHSTNTGIISDQKSAFYINTRSAGGTLHLRKGASKTSASIGLFHTGTPIAVLSYSRTGWVYVRIGQTEGYIDGDYLTPTRPTQYGAERILRNGHATGLNLRSIPSTGGELLAFIPNYSTVILLGELSDGWCYVDCNGTLGYMLGKGSLEAIK